MKIVSWNCNGKFRKKFKEIIKFNADIYVIQECENPNFYKGSDYYSFAANYIWVGDSKNKGLGIFADSSIGLYRNNWDSDSLRYFISVNINHKFDLVGVWACKPYIEEYYKYQSIHIDKYNDNTILIGDFNSNKIFDKKHKDKNHTNTIKLLEEKGLISAYHYIYSDNQGEEKINTFYMYRHLDKGFHLDHCFVHKDKIINFEVADSKDWLNYSDHIPIILEI